MSQNYSIEIKIWLKKNDCIILGPGRVAILEAISKTNSLTEATKICQISFRKAWRLLKEINEKFDFPIIITTRGGKGGGGHTYLTEHGKKLLNQYYNLLSRLHEITKEQFIWDI